MHNGDRDLPAATVARLPRYLEALTALSESGERTVSSLGLARAVGLNPANVRKDLSFLGSHGTRGVGYEVVALTDAISHALGLTADRHVVIVGAGNLGTALASYDGFARRGFSIAAIVEIDPQRVGMRIGAHLVEHADTLTTIVAERGVSVAVLAVPAPGAARAAQEVVAAGIGAILNFSSALLDVPAHVAVRSVDLSTELQILSFYGTRSGGDLTAAG